MIIGSEYAADRLYAHISDSTVKGSYPGVAAAHLKRPMKARGRNLVEGDAVGCHRTIPQQPSRNAGIVPTLRIPMTKAETLFSQQTGSENPGSESFCPRKNRAAENPAISICMNRSKKRLPPA